MKRLSVALALAAALALALSVGCGGGGAGGGGGGGLAGSNLGILAPLAGNYLEFVSGRAGEVLDPMNLVPGDIVQLRAVSFDAAGIRTVLPSGGWTVAGADAGQVAVNGNQLTILADTPAPFLVSATVTINGAAQIMSQDGMVSSHTTFLQGTLRGDVFSSNAKYVQVNAYIGATRVGGAMAGDNGTFRMRVPAGVNGLTVKGSTLRAATFYVSSLYNAKYYAPDTPNCPIPLTGINAGATNTLPHTILLPEKAGGPPPPPAPCFNP